MEVALIGTGFAAGTHARNLAAMGIKIRVVVDRVSMDSARAFAERWGAGGCSDRLEDAFAPDIDFVHICSVPTCHFEEARAALMAGKNVVCEKPLCLDADEAEELARLAGERGLVNAVCFNIRFYDACGKLRERLPGCGGLCLAHGEYLQEFHALPCEYAWRYDERVAGPMRAVTEIGSHWFDMLRYVTGEEVVSVAAQFGAFTKERKLADGVMYRPDGAGETVRVASEDAAVVAFRLSNGALGNVTLSEISHGRTNRVTLELCGRDGSLWWNSEDPYKLWSGKKGLGANVRTDSFADGFDATFRDMFAAIYGGSDRYAKFSDGAKNARICAAIYESAVAGGVPTAVKGGGASE